MTIKMKELRPLVTDYHAFFPTWRIIGGNRLVREAGPVMQGILFNRSSEDDYRPTGFVQVLTAPGMTGALELPQELPHGKASGGRRVRLRDHARERDDVVHELRRWIVPSLERPLDALEVLELYERRVGARPANAHAYSLATLHAYLGHEKGARAWCARFRELDAKLRASKIPPDAERLEFMASLERWLDEGKAKDELDRVIEAERRKLGLA
jgi:hypothetical protein